MKSGVSSRTRKLRRRARIGVLSGVVLVGFSVFVATRTPTALSVSPSPIVSHQAPVLAGVTLSGKQFSLTDYRGSFVLVNFFASWCAQCASEEPQLVAFSKSGLGKVLAVDFQDQNGPGARFLSEYHADWPAVVDQSGEVAVRWGVSAPPESFLVSPTGIVLTKIVGPVTSSELTSLVAIAKSKGF